MPTQESRTVPSHPHPAPGSTVGDPLNTAAIGVGLVAGIGGCWAVHTHGDRERSGTTLARSIAKPLAATALAVVLVFGSTACSDSDSDEDAVEQEAEDEADEAEAGLEDEADEAEAELDEAEVELRENMQN